MKIRRSTIFDLPCLLKMFDYGRRLQRELGNHYQWRNGEPSQAALEQDIQDGTSYVCVIDEQDHSVLPKGTILATFNLSPEENKLFETLDNGSWINDYPYITIQRMCTNGKVKRASQFCMQWIIEQYANVRIYTHETNKPMIHVIEKHGFAYCGRIYPPDGEPRYAYHYVAIEAMKEVM
ncbi:MULTISPECIES: hypothetical protein [unclassified Jeotgalibaca]|uniref:hypothetical protein n=1 Tax=unclassified Jeotgalibaca TaxID=2621505 RepID=UPI003FCFCFA2